MIALSESSPLAAKSSSFGLVLCRPCTGSLSEQIQQYVVGLGAAHSV